MKPTLSQIQSLLERAPDFAFSPTGLSREIYLDYAEKLVRVAAPWLDENGAIIDPVSGEEWGQTTSRFLSPGAVLLHFGRLDDLRELVYRAMDWCCMRLSAGQAQSPDFWMRELMTAWNALENQPVEPARRARWKAQLRLIEPEKIYWHVERKGQRIEDLHNWTVYAAAGEALRAMAGLGPEKSESPDSQNGEKTVWGEAFFEKYMPAQLRHFSAEGMYRDPNDPFTYDMTTRLQFATPFFAGFESSLREKLDDLLQRGALAQLLYVSPAGFAPFGGRSNQFHLQEAILAALGELEARRYRDCDPLLAGAFKRQAHLSAEAIGRWLALEPHRHLKNGFAPSTRHGCEHYAHYSVYSLFTASCLALAALFADDSIAEKPTPAEIGGYVFEIEPAFHKVFAVCGQTQVEIDTQADPHYDATGLGRFHRAGVPLELGLSGPFSATPNYRVPDEWKPAAGVAIGPAWQEENGNWVALAGLGEGLSSQVTVETETPEMVAWQIRWQNPASQIEVVEDYRLEAGKLKLRAAVQRASQAVERVRLVVPLLESDGEAQSHIEQAPEAVIVAYRGAQLTVRFRATAQVAWGERIANRNGIYRVLWMEEQSGQAEIELELE